MLSFAAAGYEVRTGDFLGHDFKQPDPDTLPEQLAEQIRGFLFFAVQEGLF